MKNDTKIKGYFYLLLTFTLWGSLYVVSKYVLGKMPAFTISFFRFALAFVALTIACRKDTGRIEKKDYKYIVFIGFAGYFIAVGAQLLGTKYAGASLASLINSLNPVTMTVFAAILLHETMTLRKVLGILLALGGVYVIIGTGAQEVSLSGVAFSLFSVLLWSFVSVLTRRITQKYDALKITRYGAGLAALMYLPVCVGEIAGGQEMHVDISCVAGLLYMGIVCTGAAYFLWNKSLSILEAGTCSAFYPIQPLVSTLLGILLLHEKVGLSFLAGAVLIVAGVLTNLSSPAKPR
ncbi:MAG: EamA family transporter [Eubacteriales bacterium]|nr:EamA family transporter [Eubacteriales bacterium]